MKVNNQRLSLTLLGGLVVITAVILKNGGKQAKMDVNKTMARTLFAAGWLLVAVSLYDKLGWPTSRNDMVALGSAAAVVASVNVIMQAREEGRKPHQAWGALFTAGWVGTAYAAVGEPLTMYRSLGGAAVVGLVMGSMGRALPWQRERCVVDGPGMPMFTAAWAGLALLNATRTRA